MSDPRTPGKHVGGLPVPAGGEVAVASFGFLASSVITSLHTAGIAFLASEPGMGRRRLVARVAELRAADDVRVTRMSLPSETSDVAANRIVVTCREVARRSRRGGRELICVDSLPVLDERDVVRVSRALRRVAVAGGASLLVTDIENEMLVEALPEAACYRSYLLLTGEATSGPAWSATGGIPALVQGYSLGKAAGVAEPERSVAYLDSLSDLVSASLRESLAVEERVLRATMLLAGRGDYADLAEAVGHVDREQLALLSRDAPLFGVDPTAERFECVGVGSTDALLACLPRMLGDCYADVASRCADLLMQRGSWKRATAIAHALLDTQAVVRFVGKWGVEVIQVGGTELAERAVAAPDVDERPLRATRLALSAVRDARPSFASLPLVELGELGAGRSLCAQRAKLMCQCRKVLRDCSLAKEVDLVPEFSDLMSQEMLVHLSAVGFMVEGEMTNAFHMLLVHRDRRGGTLSSELLRGDFRLACALVGDVGIAVADEPLMGSEDFFARSRMKSFRFAREAVDACVGAIENVPVDVDCETLANRADRIGDTLTQLMAVCAAALGDLRRGLWARAKVRADLAARLAMRASAPILSELADLLGCIASACDGEDVAERVAVCSRLKSKRLRSSWRLVAEALARLREGEQAARGPLDVRGPCPADERWVLTALCRGIGTFSDLLIDTVPESWRNAMRADVSRPAVAEAAPPEAPSSPLAQQEGHSDHPIRICVLGGVTMRVNGQAVSDRKLRTRRAKPLLSYLASTRGHIARRHEVMDAVWPECDYDSGLNRIYQSASAVRACARLTECELDPFVLNKKDGTVSLNDEVVTCDVDEYREIAMAAIAIDDNDEEVIRVAAKACELYSGDLYVPSTDTTGIMESRRLELRNMHADVMVGASEAAMRLGRARMAARYADAAVMVDNTREDAMEALLRAYDACGRRPEAHARYSAFVRQLADQEGRPPSVRLRRLAEDLWGMGGGRRRRSAG